MSAATTIASAEAAPKLAAFLYLEDVIALQRCSREHARRFGAPGAALRSRVQPRSRASFWAEAARVEADKKRALSRRTTHGGGFFESCAGLLDGNGGCARLKKTGVEGTIVRDVRRTFARRPFFTADGPGRDLLADVLVAHATASPETGYCQGMNLVCGALLETFARNGSLDDAADVALSPVEQRRAQRRAFWLCHALAHGPAAPRQAKDSRLELSELWRPGMPALQMRAFQLDQLCQQHLPKLRAHLKRSGLAPQQLAAQWYLTLFAYVVDAAWLPSLFDALFRDGWKAMHRIALALLAIIRDDLLRRAPDACGKYLRDRDNLRDAAVERVGGVAGVLRLAATFKVTRTSLNALAARHGFAVVEERGALKANEEKPVQRPRRDLDGGGGVDVRARLGALHDTTKRDAKALMARVERASRARRAALDRSAETKAVVATRKAAVGILVDEKRRYEADAIDVFDDVLGDQPRTLLAAAQQNGRTPPRTPAIRRAQSAPLSARRGLFSFLRSPSTPQVPPATPLAGALAKARAATATRSRRLKSAQRGAEKVERALAIARRHLEDALRVHAHAQGDVHDASEICLRVTAQLRQLIEGVDDKRRATLSDAASQTQAEPTIAERFRAGSTPLRAAATPPPPLLDAATVAAERVSPDEAQFDSVPLY